MRTKVEWRLTRHLKNVKRFVVCVQGGWYIRSYYPDYDLGRSVYRDETPEEVLSRVAEELQAVAVAMEKRRGSS